MNIKKYLNSTIQIFKKYKYAIIVLLLGIVLLLMPGGEKEEQKPQESQKSEDYTVEHYTESMEQRLISILGRIHGVGEVDVALTVQRGWQTNYLQDSRTDVSKTSGGENRLEDKKTVIVSKGSAYDEATVTVVDSPIFLGALIVCEGGEDAGVKLRLLQAVSALTGLSSDKITVLKMT